MNFLNKNERSGKMANDVLWEYIAHIVASALHYKNVSMTKEEFKELFQQLETDTEYLKLKEALFVSNCQ